MINYFLNSYDFNMPLEDALNDPSLSATRRMLAGAGMSQGLDDGYYAVVEIFEAFELLEADTRVGVMDGAGSARMKEILANDPDDYQRRVYYIVSSLQVSEALADLGWFAELLRSRARMYPVFQETGAAMPLIPGSMNDLGDPRPLYGPY